MNDRGGGDDDRSAVVVRGKIKVDARKAIAKLRDHLLVDLHWYSAEIARVAVAMGATGIAVEWDSDDVILTFDGQRALPAADLARARDHVLSPDPRAADSAALRVLGIGVSAALGLRPQFVDLYTLGADAECMRVRFEAKHIDEDAAAATPEPIVVEAPAGMPRPGMRVHLRRRVGMEMLTRALRRDVPREVALLLAATRDSPLVVTVNGSVANRPPPPTVLVRVDLDEPGVTRAVLEVLMPATDVAPKTVFLDLGVQLCESSGTGLRPAGDGQLPLRVLIDARTLPTNASRSEVRMDADIVRRIRSRVPAALEAALTALECIVVSGKPPAAREEGMRIGHSVEVMEAPRALYEEALGAIAADVAMAMRSGSKVSEAEAALLDLPLLLDAVGRPMKLSDLRGGTADHPLLLYTGTAPAPIELADWLTNVVWQRGRAVERAFAMLSHVSANERIALAREGHVRRARALEHPVSRPELAGSSSYAIKEAFAVRDGPFAGLEGEVAVVRAEGGYRRSSTARLFVDERLLETVQLPGAALPVDMALAWPRGFVPRLTYDSVERTEDVSRAIVYALRIAAIAVGERLGARDPELARMAMAACASATMTLGDAPNPLAAMGRLAGHAVWPAGDGSLVSFAEVFAYAKKTGAVCTVVSPSRRAADSRPVVIAEHAKALFPLLPPSTKLVDYTRALAQPDDAAHRNIEAEAATCHAVVRFARDGVEGFVGVGPNRKRVYHAGLLLRDEAFAFRNGPVLVVIEDLAAVPAPGFDAVHWSPSTGHETAREEDALLELVVAGCEEGTIALGVVEDYLRPARGKLEARAKVGGRVEDAVRSTALGKRIADLPARIARARSARGRAEVLARPAWNVPTTTRVMTTSGSVSVALERARLGAAQADVLFEGHPVCKAWVVELPFVDVVVDVTREELIEDWKELSEAGREWARVTAFRAVVEMLESMARGAGFTSDAEVLRVCEALLVAQPPLAPKVALVLMSARWPTVQGGLSTLAASATLSVGSEAFSPYRKAHEASPYDAPAVHLPSTALGVVRRSVLKRAGFALADLTEPIARLQAMRAHTDRGETPPPRLPGAAEAPRLRESLAKLGATRIEGELELIDLETSELWCVDDRGAAIPVALPLHIPVRAIFRMGLDADKALGAQLTAAADTLLRTLAKKLDGLPPFVNRRLRTLVCEGARRHQGGGASVAHGADREYAVFPDLDGNHASLARLVQLGTVRRTRDVGPLPYPPAEAPIFSMTDDEARALAGVLQIEDVTESLREHARGEQRRNAPPATELGLDDALRVLCIFVFTIDEEGVRGEVGLLRPAHAQRRGLQVSTTMRPVAMVGDGDGWPMAGMVDVEKLVTTRGFDGIAVKADLLQLQRRVRIAAASRAAPFLPAPRDAIGVVRLPVPFMSRRPDGAGATTDLPVACLGVFWLAPTWPEAPVIEVEATDGTDEACPAQLSVVMRGHHGLLPFAGKLYVCSPRSRLAPALDGVLSLLHDRLASVLVAAARITRQAPKPAELAAYQWDARLLGALADVDPRAVLATDRPDPILMRVAARRTPHLIDAATGDSPSLSPSRVLVPVPVPVPVPDSPSPSPSPSFLDGLVRWVVELVTPPSEPISESPLTASLRSALAAMKLTGDPVSLVVESKKGRPVRYEATTKRVVINSSHASLVALESHPGRLLYLLVAAVSEINRELVPVTDAEEMAVIVDLLRQS